MQVTELTLPGVKLIQPQAFGDARGYFLESYHREKFHASGITAEFVQDNQSLSPRGVLRGLHFQTGEHAQAKLVRVTQGSVLDVCVDLRRNSPTFGQHVAVELSDQNHHQLFIPRGCAHGFVVLSTTALFQYKCDNFYHPAAEAGLRYNDPALGINWRLPPEQLKVNARDQAFPLLSEIEPQ